MVHVIESSRVGGIHAGGSCVGSDEGESGGRRCASATNFRSEDGINLHKIALVTNVGNTVQQRIKQTAPTVNLHFRYREKITLAQQSTHLQSLTGLPPA